MPPKGKLPDKDIAAIEKWVKDGLPVTADRIGGEVAKAPEGRRRHRGGEEVLGLPAGEAARRAR